MVKVDKVNKFFNLQYDNELELRLSIVFVFEVLINKQLRLYGLLCFSFCIIVYILISVYKFEVFVDSVYINLVVFNNLLKDLSFNLFRRLYIFYLGLDFGGVVMYCEKQLVRLSKIMICMVLNILNNFCYLC